MTTMTTGTDDWQARLTRDLEPILSAKDPRPKLSAYHDMPFAIFQYPETAEFAVRHEVGLLSTRLQQKHGKRVTVVSLAELMEKAITAQVPLDDLYEAEKSVGLSQSIETVGTLLADQGQLDELIVNAVPADADPTVDVMFLTRAGALYPVFRVAPIVERLMGKVKVPLVLFYPGRRVGVAGLAFMGVHDPDYGYRPKIF